MVRTRLAIAGALLLAGCGSNPEVMHTAEAIARAEVTVQGAEASGGREFGAPELGMAREKLDRAREKAQDEDYERAQWLAEKAAVDAELARVKGEAGESRAGLEELRKSVAALQRELERERRIREYHPGGSGQ